MLSTRIPTNTIATKSSTSINSLSSSSSSDIYNSTHSNSLRLRTRSLSYDRDINTLAQSYPTPQDSPLYNKHSRSYSTTDYTFSLRNTTSRTYRFLQSMTRTRGKSMENINGNTQNTDENNTQNENKIKKKSVSFKNEPIIYWAKDTHIFSYDELVFGVSGLYLSLSSNCPDVNDLLASETADLFAGIILQDTNVKMTTLTQSQLEFHLLKSPLKKKMKNGAIQDPNAMNPWMEPRSIQLLLAEFFYRSAVYLGYDPTKIEPEERMYMDNNIIGSWYPGFRASKRFSVNDVRRWRRLALFDWKKEDELLNWEHNSLHPSPTLSSASEKELAASSSSVDLKATSEENGNSSPTTIEIQNTESSTSISNLAHGPTGRPPRAIPKVSLKSSVRKWIAKQKRAPGESNVDTYSSQRKGSVDSKGPMILPDPPMVPPDTDLTRLKEIANSCVSYGTFRFTSRAIRYLCDIDISKMPAGENMQI